MAGARHNAGTQEDAMVISDSDDEPPKNKGKGRAPPPDDSDETEDDLVKELFGRPGPSASQHAPARPATNGTAVPATPSASNANGSTSTNGFRASQRAEARYAAQAAQAASASPVKSQVVDMTLSSDSDARVRKKRVAKKVARGRKPNPLPQPSPKASIRVQAGPSQLPALQASTSTAPARPPSPRPRQNGFQDDSRWANAEAMTIRHRTPPPKPAQPQPELGTWGNPEPLVIARRAPPEAGPSAPRTKRAARSPSASDDPGPSVPKQKRVVNSASPEPEPPRKRKKTTKAKKSTGGRPPAHILAQQKMSFSPVPRAGPSWVTQDTGQAVAEDEPVVSDVEEPVPPDGGLEEHMPLADVETVVAASEAQGTVEDVGIPNEELPPPAVGVPTAVDVPSAVDVPTTSTVSKAELDDKEPELPVEPPEEEDVVEVVEEVVELPQAAPEADALAEPLVTGMVETTVEVLQGVPEGEAATEGEAAPLEAVPVSTQPDPAGEASEDDMEAAENLAVISIDSDSDSSLNNQEKDAPTTPVKPIGLDIVRRFFGKHTVKEEQPSRSPSAVPMAQMEVLDEQKPELSRSPSKVRFSSDSPIPLLSPARIDDEEFEVDEPRVSRRCWEEALYGLEPDAEALGIPRDTRPVVKRIEAAVPADRRAKANRTLDTKMIDHWHQYSKAMRDNPRLHCAIFEAYMGMSTSVDEPFAPEVKVAVKQEGGGLTNPPAFEFHYSNDMLYHADVPDPELGKGCDCDGPCDPLSQTCSCVKRQQLYFYNIGGEGFAYDGDGLVKHVDCAVWECGPLCGCPPECMNRVVQRGRTQDTRIELFKTRSKGWGVRARSAIPRGRFIGVYAGELITEAEGERRGLLYDRIGRTYLFDLDGYHIAHPPAGLEGFDKRAYRLAKTVKQRAGAELEDGASGYSAYSVDAFHYGFTRFVNHSCNPNLVIVQAYVKDAHPERPLLILVAYRDIRPGDELCISYKGVPDDELVVETLGRRQYVQKKTTSAAAHVSPRTSGRKGECFCGARNCDGRMFASID